MSSVDEQRRVCERVGSEFAPPDPACKVGIALATLDELPLNALRHRAEDGTSGWYIWGGETLSDDDDFFQPLHASHLSERVPNILPYLALAPGWRVLLAPGIEDLWFDRALLEV